MRRRRFQKGSLQLVRLGKSKRWVVLYYNADGQRRYKTLGPGSITKSQADKKRAEFMREVNGGEQINEGDSVRPVLLSEFIDLVFFPFQRDKWKTSTRGTSENRIQHHVVKGIGAAPLESFKLAMLQAFLKAKADTGLSFSTVDHLRWDLTSIFEMAVAEKLITANPTAGLYTPKNAPKGRTRAMSSAEVAVALSAVAFREQVIMHMAIFAGFRPGEILGLQRRHVAPDGTKVEVEQRVYRGEIDDPKTRPSVREVALPPRTAALLREWLDTAVETSPDAFVFAANLESPSGETPCYMIT